MRRLAIVAVLLVACGGEEASRPPPQSVAPAPAPAPTYDANAAALQAMQDARTRALAEGQAQVAAMQEAAAKSRADLVAKVQAERDAREKACSDSRSDRVKRAKLAAAERLKAEIRVLTISKAVRASCRIVEQKTGAVNVQRSGSGLRGSPEMRDDVQCSSLPKGATKDDAYVVLWRVRESGSHNATGPILEREDLSDQDRACEELDKAAGVDFGSVRFEDSASIDKLKQW